jgi:peptidoglycan/xylan/chitin deacetylase (PgdA/CDA1 family)
VRPRPEAVRSDCRFGMLWSVDPAALTSAERLLPILTYHSLDDFGSVLSTSPATFERHLEVLRQAGAKVLSLRDGAERLRRGDLPECALALTFDDGFRSVYEHGLPLLLRYGFTATVFVVSGFVGRSNSWPSQPPTVRPQPLLGWSQIRDLAEAGIDIGAHSHTHPHLPGLSRPAIEAEIVESKQEIEDRVGRRVEVFAYPYGAYDETVLAAAAAHVSVACSADLAFARPTSNPLALERLDVYYLRRPWALRRLFSRRLRAYVAVRRAALDLRRKALRS